MADTLIVIPGFGQSALRGAETGGRQYWPPEVDSETVLGKMKGPFMKLLFFRRDAGFTDAAVKLMREFSAPLAFGDDGKPKNETRAASNVHMLGSACPVDALKARYGDKLFVFGYHFLQSPRENAARLAAFMDEKDVSRADFLTLNFGANVLLAFQDAFGAARTDRTVAVAPCFDGLSAVADAYEGRLDGVAVKGMLEKIEHKTVASLREILKMMPSEIFDTLIKKLVAVAMEDVMLRAPGAWATAEAARVPALIEQKLSSSALSAVCEEVKAFAAIRDRRETLLSGCAVLEGDLMKVAPETWDKALALLQ